MSEKSNGKRIKSPKSTLVGGITTTMSHDNHETLAINIIIPPKPKGMNPGPHSTIESNKSGTFVSTFPVIQSDGRSDANISSSSQSAIDVKSLIGQDEDLAASKLPFVWKLYEMLEDVEVRGQEDIVSWIDEGRGFKVHNMQKFVDDIIPRYFRQSKYKSFQRQLYFYDFHRVASGPDVGAYKHPKFVKGVKTLCLSMMPKKTSRRRSSAKSKDLEDTEPEVVLSSYQSVPTDESTGSTNTESSTERIRHEREHYAGMRDDREYTHERYSSSGYQQYVEETIPKSSVPGDGDTVFVFGDRPFHYLEITFDDIYPPHTTSPYSRRLSQQDYTE